MCWFSSARQPAQRNTGSSSGRSMTTTIRCQVRQSSTITFFDNDFQVTTRYFRTTHKFVPAAGAGRYAVTIERLDNSNDANVVTLMAIHAVNVRENVVYPEDTIARITIKGLERQQQQPRAEVQHAGAAAYHQLRQDDRRGRLHAASESLVCRRHPSRMGCRVSKRTWPALTSPLFMPLPIRCRMLSLGISITPSRMRSSLLVSA